MAPGLKMAAAFGIGAATAAATFLNIKSNKFGTHSVDGPGQEKPQKPQPAVECKVVPSTGPSLQPISERKRKWMSFTDFSGKIKPWDFNWDRRHYQLTGGNGDLSPERPTATRHLILVRHGQYNLEGETDNERALTLMGTQQARETGKRISALNLPLTYVVSSTMTRARQTSSLMRELLPGDVVVLEDDYVLEEGAPYPPEPGSVRHEHNYHVQGSRIESAFRKYFHRADRNQGDDSYELIVCHSNVIRYFVCRALQLPPEAWLRISLKHASITWITIRPDGRVSLRALGEAGHLPPDLLSTT